MRKNNYAIVFFGAFDITENHRNSATSSAGNQVQSTIVNELIINKPENTSTVRIYSFKPIRTWPLGSFLWKGFSSSDVYMPPFINIYGIKRWIFSFFVFLDLLRSKPEIIVKYNITIIESLSLLIYRKINKSAFLVGIIQDVHYSNNKQFNPKNILELIAMKLVARFDMLVPISGKIRDDFNFSPQKTLVFNGGLTRQGQSLLAVGDGEIASYAVFAGALVPYNGIDVLVEKWISENINIDLHVFGKGSSEDLVRDAASRNPRIIFHGFRSEEEILNWQKNALINFCLRYSKGIEAKYFFPSKFFNIICAPGAVMTNNFEGFPLELQDSCLMLSDNLSDLKRKIDVAKNLPGLIAMRNLRRAWIEKNGSWSTIVRNIFDRAVAKKGVS